MKFGFITGLGLVLAILAPIAVAAAAITTGGAIFSAGPLNAVPAEAALGGAYSHADLVCSDCHAPFWGAELMGDRCMDCHVNIEQELSDPASLHGALADPANCRTCHTEHHGGLAELTRFDAELYPHAEFGFYLIAHLKSSDGTPFQCSECHTESLQTFNVGRCGICHLQLDHEFTEAHLVDFDTGCLNCHDGIDSFGSDFDHQTTAFPLAGKHLDLACAGCHYGSKDLKQLQDTPQECIGCHLEDDRHAGRLGEDCAACHSPESWRVEDFDHALTGFPLVAKHGALMCADCHQEQAWDEVSAACIDCHEKDDVHQGRLGKDCVACHNASDWSQVLAEDFDHSLTRYPLTGKHAFIATCEACHVGGQLAGTPRQCVACHRQDDAHKGSFGLECAACHTTSGWENATFDHNQTGFKLTGAHARVGTCTDCHRGGQFAGTSAACISCHQDDDAHRGDFGSDCSACHSPDAWRPANVNHNLLTDCAACHTNVKPANHPSGQCSQCHSTKAWKPANFNHAGLTDCAACHTNVKPANHPSGQCSQCHSTSAWRPANFDHTGQTSCLGCHSSNKPGNHYAGDCSTCHKSTTSWASNISFSHAGLTDCQSCHTSDRPSNHYAGQCSACHGSTTSWASNVSFNHAGQTDCQSCHSGDRPSNHYSGQCSACHTTTSWGNASFNHNLTAFPLTGAHLSTACTACHRNGQYAGTPKACASCHSDPAYHAGLFGTDCKACHTTSAWKPASYSRSHGFPLNHGNAGGNCSACHNSPLPSYACTKCHAHDPARMADKHAEKGITDLSNCLGCHPNGRKD